MIPKRKEISMNFIFLVLIFKIVLFYNLIYLFRNEYKNFNFSEVFFIAYQFELPIYYRLMIYVLISIVSATGVLFIIKTLIENQIIIIKKNYQEIIFIFLSITLLILIINFYKTFIRNYYDFILTFSNLEDGKKMTEKQLKPNATIENKIIFDVSKELKGFELNNIEFQKNLQFLYHKGYKIYKMDFILSDGTILLVNNNLLNSNLNNGSKRIPIILQDVLPFMRNYQDTYLIVALKYNKNIHSKLSYRKYQKAFWHKLIAEVKLTDQSLLKRIIPEIQTKEMLYTIESIYRFDNYILKVSEGSMSHEELFKFIAFNPKVMNVAIPDTWLNDEFIIKIIKRANRIIFIHNVNEKINFEELLNKGADGFYVSSILTNELPFIQSQTYN